MLRKSASALFIALIWCTTSVAFAAVRGERDPRERRPVDWRREALETMRVAPAQNLISDAAELATYRNAGFNTLVAFDATGYNAAGTAWLFMTEEQIRAHAAVARANGMPLILGMAVEAQVVTVTKTPEQFVRMARGVVANGVIPAATDDEIRERIRVWQEQAGDIVIGVFPWYDDVFWQHVDTDRQQHVYRLIKESAPDWYVFGMIGDFGFNASDDDVARFYDPRAFDHLLVLMYPFSVGAVATGVALDNVASSDPDGDLTRYIDRFLDRMNERFFTKLGSKQLIVLVVQAFYYNDEPAGRHPRANDIEIMSRRGNELLRKLPGQQTNRSAAYFSWGAKGCEPVGMADREDWRAAARSVNDEFERDTVRGRR